MDKINKKYYVDNSGNILDIISSWKVDDYYIELNNESITSLINRIEPR
jgi:hypothetical protein